MIKDVKFMLHTQKTEVKETVLQVWPKIPTQLHSFIANARANTLEGKTCTRSTVALSYKIPTIVMPPVQLHQREREWEMSTPPIFETRPEYNQELKQ